MNELTRWLPEPTDAEAIEAIRAVPAHFADTYSPNWAVPDLNAECTHKASEANSVGDLLWWDATNLCLRSASQFLDQGSQMATLQAFAAVFAGVANSKQLASDATAEAARVTLDRIWDFPCASTTPTVGTLFAPTYTSTGLGVAGCLNAQQLTAISPADPTQAIAASVKNYSAATVNAKVRMTSKLLIGLLGAAGAPQLSANLLANFRNVIDGGDFTTNPWQRGTSFSAIANTLTYTADRWCAVGGASSSISVSQQAQTDVLGFGDSLRWGRGAGSNTAQIFLGQVLESSDCIKLQGRTCTLSFWAKAGAQFSASGSKLNVQVLFSTTAGNDSAANALKATPTGNWVVTASSPGGYALNTTQVLTTTATRSQLSFPVPSTATQIAVVFSYSPTGSNNSTDTVDFYGVQLEDGPQATLFEHRDVEVELALCQRYFFQVAEPGAHVVVGWGMVNATNNQTIALSLPTQMRIAPTVTITAGGFKINVAGTETAVGTGFAAGATHTPNYITVVDNLTATVGQSVLLVGSNSTGSIAISADF